MSNTIMSNSEILDFWTQFIDSYNDWKYGPPINGPSAFATDFNSDRTFDGFCKVQKLTFCDYCEPMCEINQNCITDPIAVICDVLSDTPLLVGYINVGSITDGSHGTYWSLVHTCCNKCGNYQCNFSMDNASFGLEPPKYTQPPSISDTPSEQNNHLLQILMPLVIVTISSILAIAAFCFRKKQKSIKYKPLCQFEIVSESEVSGEAEDRTKISITELWDQIKNQNDGKDSIKMKPTKNNAPLACVLRSSDNSDSEV